MAPAKQRHDNSSRETTDKPKICGIVMPIGEIDGCSEGHWHDVQQILSEAIEAAGYEPNLVSNADEYCPEPLREPHSGM